MKRLNTIGLSLCSSAIALATMTGCGLLPDIKTTVTIPLSTKGDTGCVTEDVVKKLTDIKEFNDNKDKIDITSADLIAARVVIVSVDGAVNTASTADGIATVTAGTETFDATATGVAIVAGTKADITFDKTQAKKVAAAVMKDPYEVRAHLAGTPHATVSSPVCKFSVDIELDFVVKPKLF